MNRVKKIVGWGRGPHKPIKEPVTIALLDTGVTPHPDLRGQIVTFQDVLHGGRIPYDDSGHGTHVAGILAGKRVGMAPEAKLAVWKALDRNGDGSVERMIRAIDGILRCHRKYGIRVVNISAGMTDTSDTWEIRRLLEGVEELWDAGLVVVAAAGNKGPGKGTVTAPGTSPKIITVGSLPDGRKKGSYSGQGPTRNCVCKPDVLAPGSRIFSCNSRYERRGEPLYVPKSGTSMATPVVAGAIASLLMRYPDMTNVDVKLRLFESCIKLELPQKQQGFGMLWVPGMMGRS